MPFSCCSAPPASPPHRPTASGSGAGPGSRQNSVAGSSTADIPLSTASNGKTSTKVVPRKHVPPASSSSSTPVSSSTASSVKSSTTPAASNTLASQSPAPARAPAPAPADQTREPEDDCDGDSELDYAEEGEDDEHSHHVVYTAQAATHRRWRPSGPTGTRHGTSAGTRTGDSAAPCDDDEYDDAAAEEDYYGEEDGRDASLLWSPEDGSPSLLATRPVGFRRDSVSGRTHRVRRVSDAHPIEVELVIAPDASPATPALRHGNAHAQGHLQSQPQPVQFQGGPAQLQTRVPGTPRPAPGTPRPARGQAHANGHLAVQSGGVRRGTGRVLAPPVTPIAGPTLHTPFPSPTAGPGLGPDAGASAGAGATMASAASAALAGWASLSNANRGAQGLSGRATGPRLQLQRVSAAELASSSAAAATSTAAATTTTATAGLGSGPATSGTGGRRRLENTPALVPAGPGTAGLALNTDMAHDIGFFPRDQRSPIGAGRGLGFGAGGGETPEYVLEEPADFGQRSGHGGHGGGEEGSPTGSTAETLDYSMSSLRLEETGVAAFRGLPYVAGPHELPDGPHEGDEYGDEHGDGLGNGHGDVAFASALPRTRRGVFGSSGTASAAGTSDGAVNAAEILANVARPSFKLGAGSDGAGANGSGADSPGGQHRRLRSQSRADALRLPGTSNRRLSATSGSGPGQPVSPSGLARAISLGAPPHGALALTVPLVEAHPDANADSTGLVRSVSGIGLSDHPRPPRRSDASDAPGDGPGDASPCAPADALGGDSQPPMIIPLFQSLPGLPSPHAGRDGHTHAAADGHGDGHGDGHADGQGDGQFDGHVGAPTPGTTATTGSDQGSVLPVPLFPLDNPLSSLTSSRSFDEGALVGAGTAPGRSSSATSSSSMDTLTVVPAPRPLSQAAREATVSSAFNFSPDRNSAKAEQHGLSLREYQAMQSGPLEVARSVLMVRSAIIPASVMDITRPSEQPSLLPRLQSAEAKLSTMLTTKAARAASPSAGTATSASAAAPAGVTVVARRASEPEQQQ